MSENNPFERYDQRILEIILNSKAFDSEAVSIPKELLVDYIYAAFMNGFIEGYGQGIEKARRVVINKEQFIPIITEQVEILGEKYLTIFREYIDLNFKK